MSGTYPIYPATNGVRIVDMPDLGPVTDDSSFVAEHAGSGRMRSTALRDYVAANAMYTAPYTGALARTFISRLADILSVRDFGAAGNGAADDTAAINAALATGKPIYFPPGTYRTAGGHTLAANGQMVFGCVADQCIIQCTSPSATIFTTAAHTTGVTYRDLKLTRAPTAVANANGIDASATQSRCLIENMYVERQWIGVVLGATDMAFMRRCSIAQNLSHGVLITNTGVDTGFQWTLLDCLSQFNGGAGFVVSSVARSGAGACTLGEWINLSTYANTGCGLEFDGTASTGIFDIRIIGGFFGSDSGAAELSFNTYGNYIGVNHCCIELSGTGLTGPSGATPGSNASHGIQITANNIGVRLNNIIVNTSSLAGVVTSAQETLITGCTIINSGQAAGGVRYGLGLLAGRAMVNGCRIGNTPGVVTQSYGISVADGSKAGIVGNDLTGNVTGPLSITANGNAMTLLGNIPSDGSLNTIIPNGAVQVGNTTPAIVGGINTAGGIAKLGVPYNNP